MNILVHSKTLPVTQSIRDYVGRQIHKLSKLSRFSRKVTAVNVFLETKKNAAGVNREAEVKIQVMIPGKDIMSRSKAHDLYLAISQAMEDAGRSLRKRKEKLSRKRYERFNPALE